MHFVILRSKLLDVPLSGPNVLAELVSIVTLDIKQVLGKKHLKMTAEGVQQPPDIESGQSQSLLENDQNE